MRKKREFNPDHEFIKLCETGNLNELKKLLTVYTETDITLGNNHGLIKAVNENHLPVIEYLLDKTKLGSEPTIYQEQSAYLVACDQGKIKIIDKFFKNWLQHENQQKSNPQVWEYGFSAAYTAEKEQAIKFFVQNPDMQPYANIHLENDNCFINSFKVHRKDLLEMLILDLNIEKTPAIQEFLEEPDTRDKFGKKYKIDKNEINELFNKRDLKNNIENNLPEKNIKSKSMKI